MEVIVAPAIDVARKQGRRASATVLGLRRSGYWIGNRFIFEDSDAGEWREAKPGEFVELKIWRQ